VLSGLFVPESRAPRALRPDPVGQVLVITALASLTYAIIEGPEDVAAKARSLGGVRDDSVVADCEAALRWLKDLPSSNGKAGIIGTCSG
jgi:dienelactone hydrolase